MSGTGRRRLLCGCSSEMRFDPRAVVAEWVESSCALQGVPVKLRDPEVIRQVAALLSAGRAPDPPVRLARSA